MYLLETRRAAYIYVNVRSAQMNDRAYLPLTRIFESKAGRTAQNVGYSA